MFAAIFFPILASAATADFRVLIDHQPGQGCEEAGMPGVDQVLIARAVTTETTGKVTRMYRQICTAGVFGAPVDLDLTERSAGFHDPSHSLLIESRIAFSALGIADMPHNVRLGFDATDGFSVHRVITKSNGQPIIFPEPSPRRHAVGGSAGRNFLLDGLDSDWGDIDAIVNGIAAAGTQAVRMLRVFAYANNTDDHIYFRFDGFLDDAGPFAQDDNYTRKPGEDLSVPAKGVLTNDGPDRDDLTAALVSGAQHGDVTLNSDGSFTYEPNDPANSRTDSFRYKALDDGVESNVAKVRIKTSSNKNTPPVADDLSVVVSEDGVVVIELSGSDADGDSLTFSIETGPLHGVLGPIVSTGATTATVQYKPNPNYFGLDSFTYNANDGEEDSEVPGIVAITVRTGNDAPVAQNVNRTTSEEVPVSVTLVATDEEGSPLTYAVGTPANGVLSGTAPNLTYTPNPNFFGTDSFTYTANDGTTTSNTATVTITVSPVNDPPSFTSGGNVNSPEDTPFSASWATAISAGPPNEAGQTLTFNITSNSNPALFSVAPAIASNGTLSFTPALNATGSSNITVTLSDNGGGANTSAPVVFTITITPANDPPSFTSGGNVSVLEDSGAYSNPWATAVSPGPADEAGQTVTFNVTNNTNAALFSVAPSIASNGTLSFTPALHAFGSADITVTLSDNGGGANTSAPVTFTITVTGVNDEPAFTSGGNVNVLENSGSYNAPWATGITAGPNEGSQTLTFGVTNNTNPGLFLTPPAVAADGTLTFTLNADLNGAADITVQLQDNGGTANGGDDTSAPVTFTITVTAVNDAPSFTSGGNVSVVEDSGAYSAPWATGASRGPADENSQTLTYNVTGNTNPSLFSAGPVIDASGNLSFTPALNAFGTANITVELQDNGLTANGGDDTSAPVTFQIEVRPKNDEPSFTAGGDVTVNEDSPAYNAAWATGMSAGPANESGQTLTFNVTGNTNPSLFLSGPAISATTGNLSFTLNPNANGSSMITVTLSDNGGTADGGDDTSAPASFNINVTAVNDAPSFTSGGNVSVVEDSGAYSAPWATAISTGPPDENTQTVTFNITGNTNPSIISGLTIDSSGNLSFTPVANMFGTTDITVELQDNGLTANGGDDTSAPVTFQIEVRNRNDAPSFTAGGDVTVNEDSPAYDAAWATGMNAGPNEGGQTLQFNITGNTNPSLFSIGPAINATTGNLSFTLAGNANGSSMITVTLSDNGGTADGGSNTSAPASFNINVTAVNDAPSFTSGGDVSVVEDSGAYSAPWATAISTGPPDENTQTVTFNITGNTNPSIISGLSIDSSGNLSFTPVANMFGTTDITVELQDNGLTANGGDDTSAPVTFQIEVRNRNDAPSFTAGGDVTVNEDSPAYDAAWATGMNAGPNEGGQTLQFNITGNTNPSLFSIGPAINATTGNLSFTLAGDANGSAMITVTLSDNGGTADGGSNTSAPASFNINVTAVNDAPSFTSGGDVSVAEDSGAYSAPWATAISTGPPDENTQTVTFNITGNTNPSIISGLSIDSSGNLSFTPVANMFGTTDITVELQDNGLTANGGDDTSAPVTFQIEVRNRNDAPTFTPGGDVTVNEDSPAYDAAWATGMNAGPNEGGQTLQFNITGNTNPSLFSIGPAINATTGNLSFTLAGDANGSAMITVTLSDNGGTADGGSNTSAPASFNINVTAVNDAPSFTSGGDVSVVEDSGAYSAPWATAISTGPPDENTQTVTFNITGNTNPSIISGLSIDSSGNLSFTPVANMFGTTDITVELQDNGLTANGGDDTSAPVTFQIEVRPKNDAPTFTPGGNVNVFEDSPAYDAAWATGMNAGPNEGGQTLQFNITGNTNPSLFAIGPAINASTGNLSFTLAANANGSSMITVTLSDDGGTADGGSNTSAPASFNINVTAVNDPPTFTAQDPPFTLVSATPSPQTATVATSISAGPTSDETGTQTVSFTVTNNTNPGLFSIAPTVNSAGTVSYTAAANVAGSAVITIVAQDTGGIANGGDDTSNGQTFTITVEEAPYVVSTTPLDNATGVSPATTITINFNESVNATNPASFTINCGGNQTYTMNASPASSYTLTPDALLPATTCTVTVVAAQITDADSFDPPQNPAADHVFDFVVNTPPTAVDDTDNAIGNLTLTVGDADGVLVNGVDGNGADIDPDPGAVLTIQNPGTPITTTGNGTITFTAGGGYTYHALAGAQNVVDTVDYTVVDNNGATDVGTLTINVGPRYIFVDDTGVAGDGRDITPFHTLQAAQTGSDPNDTLVIKQGSYTDFITLDAGQIMYGDGASAALTVTYNTENFTVLTPSGTHPALRRGAAGNTITLGTNNTLNGIDVSASTGGTAIFGATFGTLTVGQNTRVGTSTTNNGAALDLADGTIAGAGFTCVSSSASTGYGLRLVNLAGTLAMPACGSISNAVLGSLISGGAGVISYGGSVSHNNGANRMIEITGRSGGSVTFSGALTSTGHGLRIHTNTGGTSTFSGTVGLTTGANTAIELASNGGSTISFPNGNITITTVAGSGITANTGGTLSIGGTNNAITTGTGAPNALQMNGVAISGTATFASINADGGATGISLDSIGNGNVKVNGGTLQNLSGDGVFLANMGTSTVTLNGVTLTAVADGIVGTSFGTLAVTGVSLSATTRALVLNTGTIVGDGVANGTFTAVNCTPNGNNVPVTLNTVGGSFTVAGGAIGSGSGGSTPITFDVIGGAATIVWNGTMSQAKAAALVSVTGTNTGNITFGGNLTATTGTGMVFTDADGTYSISGANNSFTGGSGVNISGGSSGTFTFNATTSITNGLVGANTACFTVNGSTPQLTYNGNLTKDGTTNGRLVDITSQASSVRTITFQTGTLSAPSTGATSTGILLNDVDGTVSFTGPTTLNGGDAGIDINNGSAGTISFGSGTTVTNPTGTAFDFNGSSAGVTYSGNLTKNGTSAGSVIVITDQASGTITFQTGTITNSSSAGTGIDFINVDGTVNFNGATNLSNANNGIEISTGTDNVNGSQGSITFATTSSITDPVGTDVSIFRTNAAHQGNTVSLTYNGTISDDQGTLISVVGDKGGTKTFAGSITDGDDGDGGGITLTNNTNTAFAFRGGLVLNTGATPAFAATGGGTLAICDEAACNPAATGALINKITTTTATALSVANVGILVNNLEFRSISSNGGSANGIILNTTGSLGGLKVKGNGVAGSGGTIANKTGADGSTTQGTGIFLSSTSNVSLSWMQLNDFENFGIKGSNVTVFNLDNSTINALDGTPLNGTTQGEGGVGEGSIRFDNLLGSATITDCTITHGVYDNVGVFNTTGTLNRLTVSNVNLATTTNLNTGNDALRFEISGAGTVANLTVNNDCDFTASRGDLLDVIAQPGATVDVDVIGNDFSNNHSGIASGGGGVIIHGSGVMNFLVDDNDMRGARGRGLNISKGATAGVYNGRINNNRLGVTGVANSASTEAEGIFVDGAGGGSMTVAITGNVVRNWRNEAGIKLIANNQAVSGNNANLHATITGNTTAEPGGLSFSGIFVDIGTGVNSDTTFACVDIGGAGALGNDFSTGDPANASDINLSVANSSTMRLPGYDSTTHGNNNVAQITTYLKNRNLNSAATTVTLAFGLGTGVMTGGAACNAPAP